MVWKRQMFLYVGSFLLLFVVQGFIVSSADAATKYLVAAGGNSNASSSWSNTSSASAGGDGVPTAADDIVLDAGSGQLTVNAALVGRSLNATGYTNTLTHGAFTITLGDGTAGAGSVALKLVSGMTYTPSADTSAWTFASTASATNQSVDFGGKTPGNVTFNTAGQWYLATGFTTRAATTIVTHTAGTLHYDGASDNSGLTHSWGFWINNGTTTRTTTLGTATLNITGTGTVINVVATNNTRSFASSTINMTGASPRMIAGSSSTYGTVNWTSISGTADVDTGTFATLTYSNTAVVGEFNIRGNITVTGTLTLSGSSGSNRGFILSTTLGTARTITCTGATVTASNVDFQDITFARTDAGGLDLTNGGANLIGDAGGNSRTGGDGTVTFTTPATQTWQTSTGGSWGTAANWTSRVPLPQDDATFAGFAFTSGASVTTGSTVQRLGKNITFSGYTYSGTKPTFSLASNRHLLYGSLTLSSTTDMTLTHTQPLDFYGRSTSTLTSAGNTFGQDINIFMVGGTLTLQDDFAQTGAADLTVTNGTFDANNFNVTTRLFDSATTPTRAVTMGSGTWTITGSNGNGTPWDLGTTTGLTFNANTSTILISDTSATAKTFAGGGLTYNNLQVAGGGAGAIIITGANTFNRIYTDGGGTKSITLPGSTTTTIASSLGLNNGTNVITFTASSGSATVAKSGGGVVSWDYVNLTNIPASTANTWYAGTHSTDGGGNTNWTFTDPTACTSLATGNWNTAATWDCGHVPTTSDTVTIAAGHTVTMNANSAVLGTITVNGTLNTSDGTSRSLSGTTLTIGSAGTLTANASTITLSGTSGTLFTITSGGTFTAGTSTVVLSGNGDATLNSAATTFNILTSSGTGTKTLGGALTVGGAFTISAGTVQLSTFDLTASSTTSISGTLNDNSATGTNLFVGAVTINSGGVWTTSNNPAFTFRGGLTNDSSSGFTSGTGTYTFNTNAQTISGSQSFTITNLTNDVTSGAGLTFSGAQPTVTTLTQGTNAQLTFSGTVPTITTLTATASGNTVSYTSTSGAQTVKGTTYVNLVINKSGQTATLGGNTITNGNFTISAGTLDVDTTNNYSLSVGGNFSNSGTFTARAGTVTLTSTSGSATLTSGGSAFYNLTQNGSGGTYTLQDALSVTNNLTITAGTLDANNSSNFGVTVGGTWSRSGTFTPRAGTLTLTGTSTFADTMSFYNLTVNGSGQTVTLGAALTTTGNLTITAGTLDVSAAGCTGASCAVSVGGNFSNAGTFTARTGTVTLTSTSGSATLTSGGSAFYNLTQNGSGGTYTLQDNLGVSNVLTITAGTLGGSSRTITLSGTTGTPLVVNGTFTPSTSTVAYTGNNGGGNTTITNITYNSLTVNNASETYVLAGNTVVGGDLTITAGTLDVVSGQNYSLTVGGNWSNAGTFTARSGTVTFNKSSGTQTLNPGSSSFYALTHSGAGTLQLVTNTLTVSNNLTNSAGTLDANGIAINVAGDWDNTGGTFVHGNNTFTLTGGNQSILGATTFYNLVKTVSSAATLTFEAAKTQVIAGALTLQGALNNLLSLISSSLGQQWFINPQGSRTVDYTNIRDANNSNATALTVTNSQNSGNNTNITFSATTVTWTGTTDTDWGTATNWDVGYVPNSTDNVVIPNVTNDPLLDTNRTVNNLTISSGGVLGVNGQDLTLTGNFSNAGTFNPGTRTVTLTGTGSQTFTSGGTSFYNLTQNGTGGTYTLQDNLTVSNNLTITAGTFDIEGRNITVSSTFSNAGVFRLRGTETVSLTPDTDTGTISYDNSSALTDFPAPFNDTYFGLTLEGSGTVTLANDLTVGGALTIASGSTLVLNDFDLTVTGNFSNSGTFTHDSDSTVSLNGGNQTFSPSNITITAPLAVTGSSGTVTLGSNFTVGNILTIAAGRTLSLVSYIVTLGSNLLTNLGVINEGSGYIAGTSSSFYIADSNFDQDDGISLGNESLYISMIDQDANLNGQAADSLSGVVASCPTDSETITLTETGNATELFRNSGLPVALYSGSATNNNGTLTCADAVTITATYTDPQDSGDTQNDTALATTDTVPTAPSSFVGTADDTDSITWSWTDNANNETGFKLYNSSNVLIATIATPNQTSYSESGLSAGTSYTRKLVAYNSAGNSSFSNSDTETTDSGGVSIPTAPSAFTGTPGATSITWSWTDNASNETGFKLLDGNDVLIATIATANTSSYTETGLTKDTAYTRKIAAYNGDGTSAASNSATVTTNASSPTAPALVSPADNTLVDTGLPTFSFKKSVEEGGSISSYTLVVAGISFTGIPSSSSNASNPLSATHSTDTYTAQYFNEGDDTDTNHRITVTLKDGSSSLPLRDGTYVWYVKAIDAEGDSTLSEERTITIDATSPTITGVTLNGAQAVSRAFSTQNTRPELQVSLQDGRSLREATITFERATTVLGAITSYTAVETRTYSLTNRSQTISFIPKTALTQGGSYRYQISVTDSAGHSTSATYTLSIISEKQAAQAELEALDPNTATPETIVEKLRALLPESPLNLVSLQERAVVRRQLQAEQFKKFIDPILAFLFDGRGSLERAVVAFIATLGENINYGIDIATRMLNTALLALQDAGRNTIAFFQNMITPVRTFLAQLNVTKIAQDIGNFFTIPDIPELKAPTFIATTLRSMISFYNSGVATFFRGLAFIIDGTSHTLAGLNPKDTISDASSAIAKFIADGREVRIRSGLKNRNVVDGFNQYILTAVRGRANLIALKIRATYEVWIDKTPTKISNLTMQNLTPTSVTVTWDTNHLTHLGKVNYGTTTSYTEEAFEEDGLRDHHEVVLTNLKPATTYYFEVMNQNGGYVYDAYYAVTTPPGDEETAPSALIPQDIVVKGTLAIPVYDAPNPGANIIRTFLPGQSRRAITIQGDWISILLVSGEEGWVRAENVQLVNHEGASATAQH